MGHVRKESENQSDGNMHFRVEMENVFHFPWKTMPIKQALKEIKSPFGLHWFPFHYISFFSFLFSTQNFPKNNIMRKSKKISSFSTTYFLKKILFHPFSFPQNESQMGAKKEKKKVYSPQHIKGKPSPCQHHNYFIHFSTLRDGKIARGLRRPVDQPVKSSS